SAPPPRKRETIRSRTRPALPPPVARHRSSSDTPFVGPHRSYHAPARRIPRPGTGKEERSRQPSWGAAESRQPGPACGRVHRRRTEKLLTSNDDERTRRTRLRSSSAEDEVDGP